MLDENSFLKVMLDVSTAHPRNNLNAMGIAQKATGGAVPDEMTVKLLVKDLIRRGVIKHAGTFPLVIMTAFGRAYAESLG